jgi:iron complex transport system permease protein
MQRHKSSVRLFLGLGLVTLGIGICCICIGSVAISPLQTMRAIFSVALSGNAPQEISDTIIVSVRLPRVLCAALMGAAFAVSGGAMQGLLQNPLADGTILGVSSGASLGAVVAMVFGITIQGTMLGTTTICAMLGGITSLFFLLWLAKRLDGTLSSQTMLLLGVILGMFFNSVVSLLITFASDKTRDYLFWTMGSLSGVNWMHVQVLFWTVLVCSTLLCMCAEGIDAFAMGEEMARDVGVPILRVKCTVLICSSILIGVCVSIGGCIGFVGLILPHMTRKCVGAKHRTLFVASCFTGASFLMLADMVARTLFSPRELPIGVVTSLVGAIVFVVLFGRMRRAK